MQDLGTAADDEFMALLLGRKLDALTQLGEGPLREFDMARKAAETRHEAGWDDAHIRQYLRLYGFTNDSGTVGVWSHLHYSRLMAGSQ